MPTSEAELQSWCTEMILMQNITVQKAYWMLQAGKGKDQKRL